MMKCTVLLFAQIREALDSDRLVIELPEGSTVSGALDQLASAHAAIATLRNAIAVAVNDQYASATTALNDGDTIALIPPVSGG